METVVRPNFTKEKHMINHVAFGEELGRRLREIRETIYGAGPSGLVAIAAALSVPEASWANFERGISMPAPLMLRFLVATGTNPQWLTSGSGPKLLTQSLELKS